MANQEEAAEHQRLVEERKAYGRWLQTQVKCVYCLTHTDHFSHTLGLPFCRDDHFQRYSRGEHSYFLRLAQDQLSQTTEQLQFINSHYMQGNQEGLYTAQSELETLRDTVIGHAVDYKLSVARYHAYELEIPERLGRPEEEHVKRELLHVIARLIGSLNTCIQQTDALAQQIDQELQQLPQLF